MSAGLPEPPVASVLLRVPSLARRLAGAALLVVPLFLALVGLPYELLTRLAPLGVTVGPSLAAIEVSGAAIALLTGARYVLRPTAAFGPVSMALSLVALGYLLIVIPVASVHVAPAAAVTVAIGYAGFLWLLLGVPVLGLAAAALVTYADAKYPGVRVAREYAVARR